MTDDRNPIRDSISITDVRAGDFVKVPRERGTISMLTCYGYVRNRLGDWVRVELEYGSTQRGAWVGKVDRLRKAWRDRETKGQDE